MLACLFWKHGFPVTCIVKSTAVDSLNNSGLRLQSKFFGNFIARPRCVAKLNISPDVLFITVKANKLTESLDSVSLRLLKNAALLPFLNGIEHVDLLRNRFGKKVAVGMIGKVESKKGESNNILHSSPNAPEAEIASSDLSPSEIKKIAEILINIGMKVKIFKNEREVIWKKLARNNAIACLTALTGQPLGFVRSSLEWRAKLEACVKEGALVAAAEGVNLNSQEMMKLIDSLPEGATSSLQRDIAVGKDSELDAVPGAIIRRAERYNIPCPVIKEIYRQLLDKTLS